MTEIPTFTLNNGVDIPALGFGVFQTPPHETIAAVETALATGYRHVDTAAAYGNEREVGEAIRRSGVDRSEIFVETKVWINDYGYDETLHAFDKSAGKLGVDRIDLLILHQALPGEFGLTVDAYRALEKLLAEGKVRAIGVSNFMAVPGSTLQALLSRADEAMYQSKRQRDRTPVFLRMPTDRIPAPASAAETPGRGWPSPAPLGFQV